MKDVTNHRYPTRSVLAAGPLAGMALGELQGPAKRLAKRVCQVHRWRQSKYSRTCTRCGVVEDK